MPCYLPLSNEGEHLLLSYCRGALCERDRVRTTLPRLVKFQMVLHEGRGAQRNLWSLLFLSSTASSKPPCAHTTQVPSAGKYPSSLQHLHPSSLSCIISLLGFSFLHLWAPWAMLVIRLHCPRTCVLALSRAIPLPPQTRAPSGSSTGSALFPCSLCSHLLLSSSSKGPHGPNLLMPTFWALLTHLLSLTRHLFSTGSHLLFQVGYTHLIP